MGTYTGMSPEGWRGNTALGVCPPVIPLNVVSQDKTRIHTPTYSFSPYTPIEEEKYTPPKHCVSDQSHNGDED